MAARAAVALLCALSGCVDVNGGAVELSWTVRTLEGNHIGCADEVGLETATVQLQCSTLDGVSCDLARRLPQWPCGIGVGSTRFEIPEGEYLFTIRVACQGGARADVGVPDPIRREILTGEVAQLNALLVQVPCELNEPEACTVCG